MYPTFLRDVEYAPMAVNFDEAMDWTPMSFNGTFLLTEALRPGNFNTQAKLETLEDRQQIIDTDWGVFSLAEVAAPPAPAPPPAAAGHTISLSIRPMAAGWVVQEPNKSVYDYGEMVKLTAKSTPGYRFSRWERNGQLFDAPNPTTMIIIADYTVTAYFVEV